MSEATGETVPNNEEQITFQSFDKFDRKGFAKRLTEVITKFHPFYDDAFVLSLNAKFGSGKTTFLQMWKHQLEGQDYKVISINAWETDFDDEPLIPIISAILDEVGSHSDAIKVKEALGTVLGAAAMTTNQIVKHATGIDIDETARRVEEDQDNTDLKKVGTELYKTYSFKDKAYRTLKIKLAEYIETLEVKPLIICVDELDRVRPDYSVKFLEAIKHIFPVQGICFVLAVDREQLEVSVGQLYGEIDFENYYRRFITREAYLPEVTKIDLKPFVEYLGADFFDEKRKAGVFFPFKKNQQNEILDFISSLSRACQFVPREIESFFRIFSQFMAVADTEKYGKIGWIKASVFLIGISIHSPSLYIKIGQGQATPQEVEKYIKGLKHEGNHSSKERYLIFLAMSFMLRNHDDGEESKEIAVICLKYDGRDPSGKEGADEAINKMTQYLLSHVDDFYHLYETSTFQNLYAKIEDWRSFID